MFMPVGTQATVKTVPQQLLEELDVRDPAGKYVSPVSAAGA